MFSLVFGKCVSACVWVCVYVIVTLVIRSGACLLWLEEKAAEAAVYLFWLILSVRVFRNVYYCAVPGEALLFYVSN